MEINLDAKYILFIYLLFAFISFSYHTDKTSFFKASVGLVMIFILGFLITVHVFDSNYTKLDMFSVLLYSVGFGLSFLLFTSLLLNFICLNLDINLFYIYNIFFIIILGIFVLLSLRRNKIYIKIRISKYMFFYIILPLFIFLGVNIFEHFKNNLPISLIICFISVVPLLVAVDIIPERDYPIIIWAVALSLVFYNSLPTQFFRVTDNIIEFFIISATIKNRFWNPNIIIHDINAMPGIVLLSSVLCKLLGVNLIIFYKFVLPFLASLIPVSLYELYRKRWNTKIAFYSSFFYLSLFTYIGWGSITMKMVPSAIFLVLVLFTIDLRFNKWIRNVVVILFVCSLILTHYGTSYMFVMSLIIVSILSMLMSCICGINMERKINQYNFVLFSLIFLLSWYIFVDKSSPYISLLKILDHTVETSFLSKSIFLKRSYGTRLLFGKASLSLEVLKYLYIIAGFFIFLGIIYSFFKELKSKKLSEYTLFSIIFFMFMISPYVLYVGQYEVRVWYITSILLSPFFAIGVDNLAKSIPRNINSKVYISIFLCIFLLFNTGVGQELLFKYNDSPINYISKYRIEHDGSINEKIRFYEIYLVQWDIVSAKWLYIYRSSNIGTIFSDAEAYSLSMYFPSPVLWEYPTQYISSFPKIIILKPTTVIYGKSYVYLRYFNLAEKVMIETSRRSSKTIYPEIYNLSKIKYIFDKCNKIYTNSKSTIYCYSYKKF